jgi:hypothetical protein
MLKKILTAVCFLAVAPACSGSGSGGSSGTSGSTGTSAGTSTSSSGSSGSSAGSSGGSSGGSGGITCTSANTYTSIQQIRALAGYSQVCINNLTTVYATSYGNAKPDGGTQYEGDYFFADANGDLIESYKSKKVGTVGADPKRGDVVNFSGLVEIYPADGGEYQLTGEHMQLTAGTGSAAIPSLQTPTFDLLSDTNPDLSMVGKYVTVPTGTYTQDNAPHEFQYNPYPDGGSQYVDGVALTDGNGNRLLISTFVFEYSQNNCATNPDGGVHDYSGGGFNGAFDVYQGDDKLVHKVLFFASCGQ